MRPGHPPRLLVWVDDQRRELWDAVRSRLVPQFSLDLLDGTPTRPGADALSTEAVDALSDDSANAVLATGDAATTAYRAVAGAQHPPRLVLLDPGPPCARPDRDARVVLSVVGRTDGTSSGALPLLAWRHHGTAGFGAHTVPHAMGPDTGELCRQHVVNALGLWWLDGAQEHVG